MDKIEDLPLTKKDAARPEINSRYAWYVLGVLCLVSMLSQMDRFILSILAEDVKRTFSMTDSQLGFLTGTAFALFYSLSGYPLARLADRWSRTKLLAVGLAFWSTMTVMSAFSSSWTQMSVFRAGVGLGEATATPAGYSLISDWFSKARRATALGIFSAGMNIGIGLALALGGLVVSHWNLAYPVAKPFGLEGWQVAFLSFGIPGAILAIWISTLREPARGQSDGQDHLPEDGVWIPLFRDLCGILPPLTLYDAARRGARALVGNIVAALLAIITACILGWFIGDWMQWAVLCFGSYAIFSASRSLRYHDRATFALTWGTPTFVFAMIGIGAAIMTLVIVGFWTATLAVRAFGMDRGTIGLILGGVTAVGGASGMIIGGRLSDILLKRTPLGRIWLSAASSLIPVPFIIAMCLARDPVVFLLCFMPVAVIAPAWMGAMGATIQDLVLPRMRATATNVSTVFAMLFGAGLGPYVVGKISVVTGSLAMGLSLTVAVGGLTAVGFLWLCGRGVEQAEASKLQRAMAWGDPGA
jgi:MFS family permease